MTLTEVNSTSAKASNRSESLGISGIRKIFERAQSIQGVIRLEIGEPDFQTPENIKEAARQAINKGQTKYTPGSGMLELRKAISQKLRTENGISYEPKNEIVVTAGATSALNIALLGVLDPGDEILVPNPGWATYVYAVNIVGGVPVEYKLDSRNGYRFVKKEVERLISPRTKAIIINSPGNPTGSVFNVEDLNSIAQLAMEQGITVISDEVYEKFVYEGVREGANLPNIASLPEMRDKTVILNSFSKTYAMTGWRVGYLASNSALGEAMAKVNTAANSCVSQISQIAAIEALTGPQDSVKEMISVYRKRREIIIRRLNEIPGFRCASPQGAFYAFPEIKDTGLNSYDLSMKILENAHVATVPGSAFGSEGEGYLRISYANSTENIENAMDRISKMFA
jgi:aminotransferase